MKLFFLAFSLCGVLFLTACSDSGLDGGKKGVDPNDFNPQAKPSNPAPRAYVQQFFLAIDDAPKYHPEDAAIFSTVIENNEIKQVDYYDRQNAINKLEYEGRNLVSRIPQNCLLMPAQKSKTGTPEKSTEKLSLSSSGASCNFVVTRNIEVVTTQSQPVIDEKSGWMSGTANVSGTEQEVRELRDSLVQNYTKLVSTKHEMATSAQVNYRVNENSQEQNMDLTVTGQGSMKIVLVGGEIVEGPVTTWTKLTSQQKRYQEPKSEMDMRYKFNGKSPKGDILLVILANKEGLRVFVNGEQMGSGAIGNIKASSSIDFKEIAVSALKAL